MTTEQIKKLEELKDTENRGPLAQFLRTQAALEALPRVLEERRRLLEALKKAERRFPPLDHDEANECDACWLGNAARAAIAYAEEAAP